MSLIATTNTVLNPSRAKLHISYKTQYLSQHLPRQHLSGYDFINLRSKAEKKALISDALDLAAFNFAQAYNMLTTPNFLPTNQ